MGALRKVGNDALNAAHLLEHAPHMDKAGREVDGEHDRCSRRHHDKHLRGHKVEQALQGGLGKEVHAQHERAEQEQPGHADAAVDVERDVGVVPPTCMEHAFHHPRGRELKDASRKEPHHELDEGVGQVREKEHRQERADAIDGAHRAKREPTVNKTVVLEKRDDDLEEPACKRIDEEGRDHPGNPIHQGEIKARKLLHVYRTPSRTRCCAGTTTRPAGVTPKSTSGM